MIKRASDGSLKSRAGSPGKIIPPKTFVREIPNTKGGHLGKPAMGFPQNIMFAQKYVFQSAGGLATSPRGEQEFVDKGRMIAVLRKEMDDIPEFQYENLNVQVVGSAGGKAGVTPLRKGVRFLVLPKEVTSTNVYDYLYTMVEEAQTMNEALNEQRG